MLEKYKPFLDTNLTLLFTLCKHLSMKTACRKDSSYFNGRSPHITGTNLVLSDRCLSVCLSYLSVCNVGVLWPNGWMDQDATWYTEVGLGDIVLDMGTQLSATERGTAAPTFQPTLLWHGRPSQQLLSSCTLYSVSVIPISFGGYVSGCLLSISKQVNLKTYGLHFTL